MARSLRFIPADSIVEITCRTVQGRWLLRPSPALNDLMLGVLGRALSRHEEVRLHAFVFLSNHVHLLLSVPHAFALASFMNYFNSNVAREAGRLHDWSDKLWGRRYRSIVVADEPAQIDRLRYILAHGAKEGLVRRPVDWPGASCVRALTTGEPLVGTWIDRTLESEARQRKRQPDPTAYTTHYPVSLSPLPCWKEVPLEEWRSRCQELVAQIEIDVGAAETDPKRQVLGVATIMGRHPHARPAVVKSSPAPVVHAVTSAARKAFLEARRAFLDVFGAAGKRLHLPELRAEFASLAFPPCLAWGPLPAPA